MTLMSTAQQASPEQGVGALFHFLLLQQAEYKEKLLLLLSRGWPLSGPVGSGPTAGATTLLVPESLPSQPVASAAGHDGQA